MESKIHINSYINELISALRNIDQDTIHHVTKMIHDAYENDKNIFILGNGGSASTASHMAADLNKGVSWNKDKKFRAISLTDNIAVITAYANDLSYEDIFIGQLRNFLNPGDLIIAISGSGNSKNILKAVEYANSRGNITIGLTGYNGGMLKQMTKFSINANINNMEISEDIHLIISHITKTVFVNKLQ